MWVINMEAYLDANHLWEAVEDGYEIPTLPENRTFAQMRNHKEKRLRKSKAMSVLFIAISIIIFNNIMTMKTTKEIWDIFEERI